MTADVLVQATGIRKRYGSVLALDNLDLALHRGEVLALLGPNGSGKTTTVRILATLLRPDGGRATVAGYDVVRDAARVRGVISLTGQYVAVDEKLTGRENLALLAGLYHLPRTQRRQRVGVLLDAFDLVGAADRRVSTYSGGMRRRLDLAASLIVQPQVIFLDEPTTGLDPRSRQQLWDAIGTVVADGASILLTTQYLEEADRLADRIVLIDDGRVVAEGTATELKRRVGEANVELRFATGYEAQRAATVLADLAPGAGSAIGTGVTPDPAGAPEDGVTVRVPTDGSVTHVRGVLAHAETAGLAPQHWAVRAPSLDDVFIVLTGQPAQATRSHETNDTEVTSEEAA